MSDQVFKGFATLSNHGTSQGIIPRFYLQLVDIIEFAWNKEDSGERLYNFLIKNIPDLTDFYDLYTELKSVYIDYRTGLKDGKYYAVDNDGVFRHNRSNEIVLKKKVKDFFIQGRLAIHNFGKSGVVENGCFTLNNFLIVKDSNFEKNKETCLNNFVGNDKKKYSFLIEIIENARKDFLSEFNQIRADFEHQNLQIENFEIQILNDRIEIVEPTLGNTNLLSKVEYFYEQILSLIELLMVFFYGIQAHEKTNGVITLFERDEYDYSTLLYRYVVMPSMYGNGCTKLIV